MYDCSTDGPSKARLYVHWSSNQWHGIQPAVAGTDAQAYNHCYSADSLFLCMGGWAPHGTRSPRMALSSVTGVPQTSFEAPFPVDMRTEKPKNYDWKRKEDWERYGSMLNINSLMTDDDEHARFAEKQVTHTQYIGDIRDTGDDDIFYRSAILMDHPYVNGIKINQYHQYPDKTGSHQVRVEDYNSQGYGVYNIYPSGNYSGPYDGYPFGFSGDYLEMVDEIIAQGPVISSRNYLSNTGWITRKWEDMVNRSSFDNGHTVFDLSYTYTMSWMETSTQCRSIWKVHQYVDVWFDTYFDDFSRGSIQRIPSSKVFKIRHRSSVKLLDWYTNVSSYTPTNIVPLSYGATDLCGLYSRPAQVGGIALPSFVSYRMAGGGYLNRRHTIVQDSVIDRMKDIRPAAFLAASDGLENWKSIISNNSLQNLQHLQDLPGLLPTLPDLPKLLAKAMQGDLSAIVDLIDYVTEAILKFRFQQKPTIDAATEVSHAELEKRLRQILLPKRFTVYGQFRYDFTDSENWFRDGTLALVVRSKLRVASDASTLVNGLLMADSVGLLPNLHRIWELLPFTFVIDWLTNMNNRIKAVDDQLTWLAVRSLWSLHSYTVIYYPSAESLAHWGLEQYPGGKPFGIKVYTRELTRCTPSLRESMFDFLRRPRGPDPVTVGALVWQLLR